MCGLELTVEGEAVTSIRGDAEDPFSRGYHCIKGEALADLHADPHRLRQPVRRTKVGWEKIGWSEAFAEVAANLHKIQAAHGRDAVASYIGNPNAHNYGGLVFLQRFLRVLRSKNRFAATSVDQLPHHMVSYHLFGHQLLVPIPDIDRTDFMIIMGGNPVVSRGSMMSAPDVTKRISAIRERGGRVVLIDPRKTETAAVVDEHHFIRPGMDAALLLGLLHVVFAEKRATLGTAAAYVDGIEAIEAMVQPFSPERVAPLTGITAAKVRELATGFAGAKTAVCYGRVGVSTQEFGTLCQWLITVLNVVTGNLDRVGGAMFTTPALDPLPYVSRGHYGKWKSRVRGLPEFSGELPVATLTEEILTPGPGQIKALFTCAGNPVLSTPNGARLEGALAGLEYMVSVDIYVNETTRHANVILPPTGALEHEHYDAIFHLLAVRNTARYSAALFAPAPGAKHEWQILAELERGLIRARHGAVAGMKAQWTRLITPERMLELGLRFGPQRAKVSLGKLKKAVRTTDLGPLEPRLPERLFTKTKRVNLAPALYVADVKRFEAKCGAAVPPLVLIGRRQVRVNNSWMGHFERLTKGRGACTLLMHKTDGETRGIATGDVVRVTTAVGSLEIPATLVESIMVGVVSIPHGYGHSKERTALPVAEHARGVSVNDVTDPGVVDLLSGNAVLNGVPVDVVKLV